MTKHFAVIGSPVAHSKSPAMHGAAYRALGLPHDYVALETSKDELAARVAALESGAFDGLNVTVPHKTAVVALCSEVSPRVVACGAANTLVRTADGRVRAENTDVPALAEEILALGGRDPAGGTGLVIGSGGAARAAILSLASLGVTRIEVRARAFASPSVARAFAEDATARSGVTVVAKALLRPPAEDARLVAILQATSCGMVGASPGDVVAEAVAWTAVPAGAVAVDAVYAPPTTPFLEAARAVGVPSANGAGMLARQGALAFELWLGVPAPLSVMRDVLGLAAGDGIAR